MPELPEIETIKLQLRKVLVGQRLVSVSVSSKKTVQSDLSVLIDKKVMSIERVGKMLLIKFNNDLKLGFHFKMTGQLVYEVNDKSQIPNPKSQTISKSQISKYKKRIVGGHPTEDFVGKLPSKHTRAIFYFNKGTLYFNDQRKFGWVRLFNSYQLSIDSFASKLGPEPFDLTSKEFVTRLRKTKRAIKIAIMDQEIISGVGNIYANDALWESGIHPDTGCARLSEKQLKLLFEKIKLVLKEGIKYGGATSANYVDLHGLGGHYQEHFRVYKREGLPCFSCKTLIKKIKLGGRGTYFCPMCQR